LGVDEEFVDGRFAMNVERYQTVQKISKSLINRRLRERVLAQVCRREGVSLLPYFTARAAAVLNRKIRRRTAKREAPVQ